MLLKINDLVKVFNKNILANDGISLHIEKGEVFGLLGPNGAGKTTMVNQIIGLTMPTSGSININGIDVVSNPDYARQNCSFQSQTQVPIAGLTAIQAIELVGLIRGGNNIEVQKRTKQLIDNLEIGEWANKMGATLSGGVRRIVAFCMAAVFPGSVVILDEPTNDIDPVRRRLLWNQVRSLADMGSAVLLVTHNVLEAERAVDRLTIIDQGKVVGTGTAADLKGQDEDHMRLELVFEPGMQFSEHPDLLEHAVTSRRRVIGRIAEKKVVEALEWAQSLKEKGVVEEFFLGPTTLEDAYVRMVGRTDVVEITEGDIVNEQSTS
ncbi:MAG: ABC transporter ATP-binding protein [Dehalococcoidia bacterium]|nr:MAG: ABC transporter ATP-binding protein [Dehalococcoidia bacterium]